MARLNRMNLASYVCCRIEWIVSLIELEFIQSSRSCLHVADLYRLYFLTFYCMKNVKLVSASCAM